MEPVVNALSSFKYDARSYEEFINKEQNVPWNEAYIEGYWEKRAPTELELEDYRLEINSMVGTIEGFERVFHDSNQTEKWNMLRYTTLLHATKFNEYWSEYFYFMLILFLTQICN